MLKPENSRVTSGQLCFVFLVLTVALIPTWLYHPQKADVCSNQGARAAQMIRHADGVLPYQGGLFFTESTGNHYSFLPLRPPSRRGPEDETRRRQTVLRAVLIKNVGSAIQAQICGQSIIRIDQTGHNLLNQPALAQSELDAEFVRENRKSRLLSCGSFVLFLFTFLVWSLKRWRVTTFGSKAPESSG
jgi:hypothetical protein